MTIAVFLKKKLVHIYGRKTIFKLKIINLTSQKGHYIIHFSFKFSLT